MRFIPTAIPDVILIEPYVFEDDRGFFFESWQREKFAEGNIDVDFVQDNHSRSVHGVLRGLHYQIEQPQGKLVRVSAGEVFDVAVDIRRSSPTFGQWVGIRLSAGNKKMLWIPEGFAHGFLVTSDAAEFQYRCTDYYNQSGERCIRWDDPALNIRWPVSPGTQPVLSAKDREGRFLEEADTFA